MWSSVPSEFFAGDQIGAQGVEKKSFRLGGGQSLGLKQKTMNPRDREAQSVIEANFSKIFSLGI